MVETKSDPKDGLGRWLQSFLECFNHEARHAVIVQG